MASGMTFLTTPLAAEVEIHALRLAVLRELLTEAYSDWFRREAGMADGDAEAMAVVVHRLEIAYRATHAALVGLAQADADEPEAVQ